MMSNILKLDAAGHPVDWIDAEKAAYYVTKGRVLWDHGAVKRVLRGGHNNEGVESVLELPSIMAIRGKTRPHAYGGTIALEKAYLFRRDRNMCAYCGNVFKEHQLELEHIHPECRGGKVEWMNIVAACRGCNARKADRTPEEAGMPLLFVPYIPNMHEGLLLKGRRILADQMEWLLAGVPKHSRLHGWIENQ